MHTHRTNTVQPIGFSEGKRIIIVIQRKGSSTDKRDLGQSTDENSSDSL